MRKCIKRTKIYLSSKQAELADISNDVSDNSDKIHLVAGHVANISDHVDHNYVKIHLIADHVDNVKVSGVLYSKFFIFRKLGNQNICHISSNEVSLFILSKTD